MSDLDVPARKRLVELWQPGSYRSKRHVFFEQARDPLIAEEPGLLACALIECAHVFDSTIGAVANDEERRRLFVHILPVFIGPVNRLQFLLVLDPANCEIDPLLRNRALVPGPRIVPV